MTIRPWLAVALAATMLLVGGCNKSGNAQNSTQLRTLNAVIDAEPLDVLIDDDVKFGAVALGTTTALSEFDSGDQDVKIRSTTTSSVLAERTIAFNSGAVNTLILYGKRGNIGTVLLPDTDTSVSGGKFKVRAVGLSGDSGPVDIYVVQGSVNDSSATIPSVTYLSTSAYSEINAGSYNIVMTVAGTKDVVFQSSAAQAFSEGSKITIGVFPSAGGKLVSAWVLTEGGTGTLLSNPVARMKVINAIPDSPALNFKSDGTTLLSSVPFTGSSSYVNIASGSRTLTLEQTNVPGVAIATKAQTFESARDYTVLALDTLAAPRIGAITDDNTFPSAGFAKVRFLNALQSAATADVLVNFASAATGVAYGGASAYSQFAASATGSAGYTITFSTPGGVSVIASLANIDLDAGVVYTAVLLGPASAPQVKLVRDR